MKGFFLAYADLWEVGNIPGLTTQHSPMRNYFFCTVLCCAFSFIGLQAQTASDEFGIQVFTRNFMAAYNKQDLAELQKMYTEAATYVAIDGEEFYGPEQIAAAFGEQFKANNVTLLLRQTQIVWSDIEEALIAMGTYEIYGRTNVYDINIHSTGVYAHTMVEYNGEWKIARSAFSPLVKVLVHHQVADFATWKSDFAAGASRRSAAGEIDVEFGTLYDDPKTVYVLSEWISLEAFQAYFTDPETEKVMRAAGVTGNPTVLILDTNKH